MNVYILRSGEYFKVGVSGNVERRIKELQTGAPHKIELVALKRCEYLDKHDKATTIERQIHKSLGEYKAYGEWFKITQAILQGVVNKFDFQINGFYQSGADLLAPRFSQKKTNNTKLGFTTLTNEEQQIAREWSEHLTLSWLEQDNGD